jgi:predicted P-loop ATPase
MPHLLKNLTITSIASVDRGAADAPVLICKRDNPEGNDTMDVISKAMQMNEREMIAFAKSDGINKQELGVLIDDMAQSKRRDGESREQAFSRFITENPTGVDLFKIHQAAPGRDHHQQAAFEKFHKAGA